MEKDLFPPFAGELPMTDRSPRMDRVPEEGPTGGISHDHEGCGCTRPDPHTCHRCEGYEGCGPDSWGLCEYPLAMVYAPCQTFRGLYDPATALAHGTLFSELNLPLGREGCGLTTLACGCGRERRQS